MKKRLEKYQTTKPQGKKAKDSRHGDAENVTTTNSTCTNSSAETGTATVDNVPSSSAHSYTSSEDFSSITEISSVELSNIARGTNDDQVLDIQQSTLDDFPVIDDTFWSSSSQDFTLDDNDLNFVFSNMEDDAQLELQSQSQSRVYENSTVPETYNSFSSTTYTEDDSYKCEDNMDFWLDVFVKSGGASELPEFDHVY